LADYLRVIEFQSVSNGRSLNILMDGSKDEAVGYLVKGQLQSKAEKQGSVSRF
jgi:hypothetical protein